MEFIVIWFLTTGYLFTYHCNSPFSDKTDCVGVKKEYFQKHEEKTKVYPPTCR